MATKFLIRCTALIIMTFQALCLHSQTKATISGTVKDKATGEQLIGVIVSIPELKGVGVSTNEYGYYSLTLPKKTYVVNVSLIGYKTFSKSINLENNQVLDVALMEAITEIGEVVVTAGEKDQTIVQAQMGVEKLDVKEINKIPVLMGEKDILKTIQLLPGIKSSEGSTGFYVRGGGSDQNLILLDEAPVYNASHLMGFFSTFNSDALKDLAIYKGTMPAQYGGRLSSVLDIKMNDGNDQNFKISGGLGLISSKLALEGPIVKNRGSFLLTGRRTYADIFLKLSKDENIKNNKLYFYDINAKANYRLNDKNRLYLSIYNGQDQLGFADAFNMSWGNTTATLRWNHIVGSKMFSNTSLIYSLYNYKIGINMDQLNVDIGSNIENYNLKHEYSYFLSPKNKMRFGFNAIHHKFIPGNLTSNSSSIQSLKVQEKKAIEGAVFFSNEWSVAEKLNIVYGLRATSFSLLGSGNFYEFNAKGETLNTIQSKSNQIVKTYFNVEPRFSMSYILNKRNTIKLAFGRNTQNLHLISNSTSGSPTDYWLPSSLNIKPEISDQVSLGYFGGFMNNMFEYSAELYYKDMKNQIDYKDGASAAPDDFIEKDLLYGIGRAYGVEFVVKKKTGKFTGWIGYTLSRSERKIDGINNNNWYLAKQDRTHDISIVGIYDVSKKWSLSATWVYYTGNAVTFPSGKYYIDGEVNFQYSERNSYRMPSYHRLDIGATWYRKRTEKIESSWNFSIYNAYARENAYSIKFQQDPNDPTRTQVVQTTLFKIVPSITYNFKF